jgi:hypothetical protein
MWKCVSAQMGAVSLLAATCLAQTTPGGHRDAAATAAPPVLRMVVAGGARTAASQVAAGTLYGAGTGLDGSHSSIFSVASYSSNPVATPLASFPGILVDIGIDPTTLELYVLDDSSTLWLVDLAALTATQIGTGSPGANALVFDAAGQAYEWGFDGILYAVDKSSGIATGIGNTGYTSAGDLAFDLNGTLYGTAATGELIRIDPGTGAATLVGQTGFADFFGLAIDATGTLYGARGSQSAMVSKIYRFDKTSGASSLVGSIANDDDSVGGLALVRSGSAPGHCTRSATTACLVNGRFQVTVSYENSGSSGQAQVMSFAGRRAESDESVFLYFTDPSNFEMGLKILPACGVNNHFWVFIGGLTNQGWQVSILDTSNGRTKSYSNALNHLTSTTADTSALPCP